MIFSSHSSKLMRTLALAAHFSPLISGHSDHTHFLERAPVLQVPWSDLAIHILHHQVRGRDSMSKVGVLGVREVGGYSHSF